MDKQEDSLPTTRREAVQWLLLAYSLGHAEACSCEVCRTAWDILRRADDEAAA